MVHGTRWIYQNIVQFHFWKLHFVSAEKKYREQCWRLDTRGTVGETILHLCMLSATQIHFDLAKRLIQFFPKMINDIYVGEEYYGKMDSSFSYEYNFMVIIYTYTAW